MKDYKMKDHTSGAGVSHTSETSIPQTNYPTSINNTLTPYYGEKIFSDSYEELEAKVWHLEHELQKRNLYAELGRFIYNFATDIEFDEIDKYYHFNGIMSKIQKSEAGDEI